MNETIFAFSNKKVKLKDESLSLRDFHERRNKVLILRDSGGLGDILMLRMIFHDFKKLMPEVHMTFAIPDAYNRAAMWHPYIDEIVNSKTVDENQFGITYNVTTACIKYEMSIRPRADRHRAEIWANYCGVNLTEFDMCLNLPTLITKYAENTLKNKIQKGKGYVCLAPISNMISKDLDENQIKGVIKGLRDRGYSPYILHNKTIPYVDCPVLGMPLDQWVGMVNAADYVITVDTAVFHASNGLNKPVVAVYSWADGKVYTKFHKRCVLVQKHRDHTPGWTCGPCYAHPECVKTKDPRKPCITEITVEEILNGFDELISNRKSLPLV